MATYNPISTHMGGAGGVYPPIPKVLTALGRYAGNEVILCKFVMLRRSLMCILELLGAH